MLLTFMRVMKEDGLLALEKFVVYRLFCYLLVAGEIY